MRSIQLLSSGHKAEDWSAGNYSSPRRMNIGSSRNGGSFRRHSVHD